MSPCIMPDQRPHPSSLSIVPGQRPWPRPWVGVIGRSPWAASAASIPCQHSWAGFLSRRPGPASSAYVSGRLHRLDFPTASPCCMFSQRSQRPRPAFPVRVGPRTWANVLVRVTWQRPLPASLGRLTWTAGVPGHHPLPASLGRRSRSLGRHTSIGRLATPVREMHLNFSDLCEALDGPTGRGEGVGFLFEVGAGHFA